MKAVFELQNATFEYGRVNALRNVSMKLEAGDRVALLGSNGSGKSTLLRVLDALLPLSAGKILFDGVEITEDLLSTDEFVLLFRRRVALLFQDPDVQLFNPTVFDELAFGPLQLRWPRGRIEQCVLKMLERMEISHLRDRAPHRLSGGEKKRAALASILVLDPEVLLLDEPTAALDPRSQSQFVDFIRNLDPGRTVVTATHDLDTVEDIANYCYVLSAGSIIAKGTPGEILADTRLLESVNLIHSHHHTGVPEPHYHPHRHDQR
ncbi:MAG: ABC transporter ATP-binding protein [Bryobacteraceae bacterium]|nr:ABC transporter ATP-binding protein [Bryobacteraceae bacterium]